MANNNGRQGGGGGNNNNNMNEHVEFTVKVSLYYGGGGDSGRSRILSLPLYSLFSSITHIDLYLYVTLLLGGRGFVFEWF